ncbi:hypothetical protein IWW55_004403 [Coemansia sp. RSA 2706]|nr:hypothetical protein LPJ63_002435 [Coemansia sp. RSA 2711]KAJ2298665.1 hypothetical protein IWW55_004403 [Coemansia sp. RSA 2706]KAJ2315651.1 hypothetical protein IWW54_000152 [Coemansia sp. RSA 2705]KAJ2322336.1 hypothetical protein IWW52_000169 [Coemansia sp. RSA 2704]KAJ2323177.1 hypothetical protein IWW51_003886 [Coemansia sp. RSA 2702]KAJ2369136.1 hypothetical protein H4S01_001181 [Coemansia sp. RSA 2610]KAJ2393667.1 hypothetical protein H4S02_000029 [Coemansia sp. RSA 2611]KAJ273988
MKWILATSTVLAAVAAADSTTSLRVARDATVAFNGIMCNNDTVPCSSLAQGLQNTVVTFRGNRDYERVLLGFDLPLNAPKKCVLRIPKPAESTGDSVEVTVAATDSVWDEATVSGYNKKLDGTQVGTAAVSKSEGGTLDVTEACANASNHKLSLFVDTTGSMITFNSVQSGSGDVFVLDYTF